MQLTICQHFSEIVSLRPRFPGKLTLRWLRGVSWELDMT